MSIPLKLFIDGLSNGSLFSETSALKANLDLMFLVKAKKMADSVEIQFVDGSGPPLSLKFPHLCQPQIEVTRCAEV